ncbi:hypothetical protein BKA65DRAFT_167870 [Rhexocercosporidium sp. MPI-PUGE-AT-0058]|nr:hypothetical protein BKA65DRAFT_167870 [Rhexocercosporidium sp. MPI-PUGE-AT-0058]
MSSLDSSLSLDLPLTLKLVVVEYLWGRQPSQFTFPGGKANLEAYFQPYFKYYAQQCTLIGRHAKGKYSSVETHNNIMHIAQLLRADLPRETARKHMSDFLICEDGKQHDNSINLAARLLSMVRVGDVPHELGGRHIEWQHGAFREFIHRLFAPTPGRSHDRLKLERSFKALNVKRIAGIEIWWTDNLADHLRMMDDDNAVFIFHHASFLEYQLHNTLYPPHFIEETLRTISLLFPRSDPATRKWFQKAAARSTHPLDMRLVGIGNLNTEKRQLENFTYWHDRLVILKEVYDDARPNTLSQFWWDNRNGPQWYGFWVALWVMILTILTIFIGFVQCVEGGLQVYKAFKT